MAKVDTKTKLRNELLGYDKAYYNTGTSLISDDAYDDKRAFFVKKYPSDWYSSTVGAPVEFGEEITLDRTMGSLTKVRPDSAVDWCAKLPPNAVAIFMPKIDGQAFTIKMTDGIVDYISTRGEGTIGLNVTKNARFVQGTPKSTYPGLKGTTYIYGECALHISLFKKYFAGSGKKTARNTLIGLFNTIKLTDDLKSKLRKLTFIAYGFEHFDENGEQVAYDKRDQFGMLESLGFTTVLSPFRYSNEYVKRLNSWAAEGSEKYAWEVSRNHPIFKGTPYLHSAKCGEITEDMIRQVFKNYDQHFSDIDRDGIVIEIDDYNLAQKLGYDSNGLNPAYARAIKLPREEQLSKTATVEEIDWSFTTLGYKPTLVFKNSVDFKGASIDRVYANNAKFVKDNKIGPGSVVRVVRSGDVIPYIMGVEKPLKRGVLISSCYHCGSTLEWNGVDLQCPSAVCIGKKRLQVENFFLTLQIDGVGPGVLDSLIEAGFSSVPKLLAVTSKDLLKVDGFAAKKAATVATNLNNCLDEVSLPLIMHASGFFHDGTTGLGESMLKTAVDNLGVDQVLEDKPVTAKSKKYLMTKLTSIDNFGEVRATLFCNGLGKFRKFYNTIEQYWTPPKPRAKGKLTGLVACFTKFRDYELQALIENNGGEVVNSVTNKVTVLFAKEQSTKTDAARRKGIEVVTASDATLYVKNLIKKGFK